MASITKLIERMRYWCDDVNLGYSQSDRWDFNPQGGNCDCSSLVIHCLQEAGFDPGDASYTGNLSANLTARGWERLPNDGHPQAGDILLNDADHVAVYLGGGLLAQASISEAGGIDGEAGDQTGGETNTSSYYDYPWDCYLRWTGTNDSTNNQGDNMVTEQEMQRIAALTNSYRYGDDPNTVWNYLTGNFNVAQSISRQVAQVQATLAAQSATIETLAKAVGANPADIAASVQQAVKDKLDQLHITIEEVKP